MQLEKITTDAIGLWFIMAMAIILISANGKELLSRILLGLYDFFIGSKDHVAPI